MSSNCDCPNRNQQEVAFEGSLTADIIFVLESPGRDELIQKRPAVGEAGVRWENVINEAGFRREDVFIINPSRCRLDKKALGAAGIKKVIAACRGALVTAIQHIKPKIVVACGGIASHAVLGVPVNGVKNRRGRWEHSSEFDCQVLHTYHPSFTLRDPSQLPYFKQDMQELRRVVDNNFDVQRHEDVMYIEVDSIGFLLDRNPEVVGFDTETQGLKWFDDDFVLISYSVSDEKGKAYQIVLWEEGTEEDHDKQIIWNRDGADVLVYIKKAGNYAQKMIELQELCGNGNIKKYVMTSYDEHVLESQGITKQEGFVLDVQIGAHVLNSDVYRNAHLADLEASFSDIDGSYNYSFAETYRKEDMLWSLKQDRESFMRYAASDADGVRRVGLKVKEELMKNSLEARYYVKLVHPITKTVLYNMSKNGMLIDMANLPKVSANISEERDRLEDACLDLVPDEVKEMAKHKNQLKVVGKKRPLNRRLFIADTLFSQEGFGMKPLGYTGKAKEPKTDQDTLRQLKSNANKRVREFIDTKFERDEYHTLYTRYIKNIEKYVAKDNRVHPSMSTTFTVTGRCGCIRKGTPIEIVRDVDKFPEGIPIEEVEVGSWAYSFDDLGQPTIKKVIGKQCTGRREIIRIYWKNQPNSKQGYLDLTPEHEVRLANGEYVPAIALKSNMSICSLYRGRAVRDNRSHLYLTNTLGKVSEHRFVFSKLCGVIKKGNVVHHKDTKRNNHVPDNLEQMEAGEHSKHHNKVREWRPAKLSNALTPFRVLYLLAKAKGQPSKVPYSFMAFMPVLKKYGIDFSAVHKRYNTKGEYLSRGKIKRSLAMVQKEALHWLGINYYKWQYLIDLYGFIRPRKWGNQCGPFIPRVNNHLIDRVEVLGITDEVWDLEIEDTHNFVAGNLSVHNSRNINSMNLPKRGKQAKLIRSLFIAPPGSHILNVDASQAELRWIAHESQDARMLEAYRNDEDLHTITAINMIQLAGKVPEDLTKEEMKEARQAAKPKNFGLSYLMSAWGYKEYALNDYGISMTKAQAIADRNAWFTLYPGIPKWHEKCIREMYRDGGVRHAFGRFRHLPNLFSNSDGKRHAAEREGVNDLIQGPSSDAVLLAGKEMYEDGFIDRPEIKLINFVHDNLTFEVRGVDSYIESLAREVVDRMSNSDFPDFGFSLSVPMKADAELGTSLADLEELSL